MYFWPSFSYLSKLKIFSNSRYDANFKQKKYPKNVSQQFLKNNVQTKSHYFLFFGCNGVSSYCQTLVIITSCCRSLTTMWIC